MITGDRFQSANEYGVTNSTHSVAYLAQQLPLSEDFSSHVHRVRDAELYILKDDGCVDTLVIKKLCEDHGSRIALRSSYGYDYDRYRSLWRIRDNLNTLDVR